VHEDPRGADVHAIYAFPLFVGSLDIGAVDLYSTTSTPLQSHEVADASELASVAAWQVLRRILSDTATDDAAGPGTYNRREVHQATGMVLAQLDITAEEAALLLRAHAFSSGRSVAEVANDVVERRLNFAADSS
jgi:AmiR/NasT family two-component response regulator